jgi:hypothetical protein
MKQKTKVLRIRVTESMYDFLQDISSSNNVPMSEMIRKIIDYFFIGHLMGEFKKSLPELRKEFMEKWKPKSE